jgi:hypothetical protein
MNPNIFLMSMSGGLWKLKALLLLMLGHPRVTGKLTHGDLSPEIEGIDLRHSFSNPVHPKWCVRV